MSHTSTFTFCHAVLSYFYILPCNAIILLHFAIQCYLTLTFSHTMLLYFTFCYAMLSYFHILPYNAIILSHFAMQCYYTFTFCHTMLLYFHILLYNAIILSHFAIQCYHTFTFCHTMLSYSWNSLPNHVKECTSLSSFKQSLYNHMVTKPQF